ncbi:hypothetical protein PoB_000382200 [Plakobranchus ocellatus]|uniref:Uncharacterized protein n=1 Tax=Plakobranchus ocellatus TaxID=259542 RepID=A0AAV3Y5C0_9GAST|nr:hypothetical protein PoB_000382200 [Plakobranchus ocellatus]
MSATNTTSSGQSGHILAKCGVDLTRSTNIDLRDTVSPHVRDIRHCAFYIRKGERKCQIKVKSTARDLGLSGPPLGQGAGGVARFRDTRAPADLRADSLATVPPTPPVVGSQQNSPQQGVLRLSGSPPGQTLMAGHEPALEGSVQISWRIRYPPTPLANLRWR